MDEQNQDAPEVDVDGILAELALLSDLDYERERKAAAQRLNMRVAKLDKQVEERRPVEEIVEEEPASRPPPDPNNPCPSGFRLTDRGVIFARENKDGEKSDVWVTFRPVTVEALSRDGSNENWGRLVRWTDHDGREHERAISAALFHASGPELAQVLASGGLPIAHGSEKLLLRYLTAFRCNTRLLAATATGWHGEAFVLPSETLNEPAGERIVFQPAGLSNTSRAIHRKGSLDEWKKAVEDVPPIAVFGVCVSLAAPLRFPCDIEGGGFNLHGQTSRGKTTTLQASASVWGDAVDPQQSGGREAYIQRWNSTANALEAKAEAFNDLPLVVDEIGEGDGRSFGQTIYRILSGTGRARSKRDGSLADPKTWRTTILSAGELPVSQYIEEGGSRVRGGQLVRLVDVPYEHGFTSSEQADHIKKACALYFGHAGPALLESGDLISGWDEFAHERLGDAITPEAKRVRKRFALAAYAGSLAADRSIVPWSKEAIIEAARLAYQGWLSTSSGVSDSERGVENVVAFLLKHGGSRFERDDDLMLDRSPPIVRDRAGWFRDGIYHFTPGAFKDACAGAPEVEVKRSLRKRGWLKTNSVKDLSSTIRVDGQTTRVVSVRAEVLGFQSDLPENGRVTRDTRVTPSETRDFADTTTDTTSDELVSPPSIRERF